MINDNLGGRLSFDLKQFVSPYRTITTILPDRANISWWWHQLLLRATERMISLFSVHHERTIPTVLFRTQISIKNFASNSEFCETCTIGFTLCSCYLNNILKRSGPAVKFSISWATSVWILDCNPNTKVRILSFNDKELPHRYANSATWKLN